MAIFDIDGDRNQDNNPAAPSLDIPTNIVTLSAPEKDSQI